MATLSKTTDEKKLKIDEGPISPVVIRRAQAGDAARVAELNVTLGYAADHEMMATRLARILSLETHAIFVARITDEIVGWIEAEEREVLALGKFGEICGLVVAEGRRGLGVGRRLVAAAEEWLQARGHRGISVRSNIVRPESHAFYERIGYTRYKTQHAYRKSL
ncbi:MAG: GNAT family N-acetyltransferase [Chthoniobacterales bacterium]